MRLLMKNETIYKNSYIDKNIDGKDVKLALGRWQTGVLKPAIGTDLLNNLLQVVVNGTGDLKYHNLLQGYVWPALIPGTCYYLYKMLWVRATNRGVIKRDADNAASASVEEFRLLSQEFKEDMINEMDVLKEYLDGNLALFPEYNSNTDPGDIKRAEDFFIGGFFYTDEEDSF